MPGALTEIINIQTTVSEVQNAVNNLNQANSLYAAASLISTTTLQSELTSIANTVNAAAILASNNVINGNQ